MWDITEEEGTQTKANTSIIGSYQRCGIVHKRVKSHKVEMAGETLGNRCQGARVEAKGRQMFSA